jgi:hypothetical protein
MRDLPNLVYNMVSQVVQGWLNQESRYEGYADTVLDQSGADEIMGKAMRYQAIPPSKLRHVLNEWDKPQHDEFKPRNAWSMFNSFTEVMKSSPRQLPQRSITLHRAFDEFCSDAIEDRIASKMPEPPTTIELVDPTRMQDVEVHGNLIPTRQVNGYVGFNG